jgi:hypothetical protein
LALTAIIIACKFYCETEDVVVNEDIARLMKIANHSSHSCLECISATSMDESEEDGEDLALLNSMEARLLDLLKFELYVSPQEYNDIQRSYNQTLKK